MVKRSIFMSVSLLSFLFYIISIKYNILNNTFYLFLRISLLPLTHIIFFSLSKTKFDLNLCFVFNFSPFCSLLMFLCLFRIFLTFKMNNN